MDISKIKHRNANFCPARQPKQTKNMPQKSEPTQESAPPSLDTTDATAQNPVKKVGEASPDSQANPSTHPKVSSHPLYPPANNLNPDHHHPTQEQTPSEAFEEYYLRQVTADFADDIEKLRNASDFKESSVPVLVQALKQGAGNFSEEEKRRVMGKGGES